jgi:hypothetical protein
MAYGTDIEFAAYLSARGLTVAGVPAVLRQLASDYLDATYCFGSGDVAGANFLAALYRAAYLADGGTAVLFPVTTGARVKRQKVDVIEREFFDDGADSTGFIDPVINGLMRDFLCGDVSKGLFFQSVGT